MGVCCGSSISSKVDNAISRASPPPPSPLHFSSTRLLVPNTRTTINNQQQGRPLRHIDTGGGWRSSSPPSLPSESPPTLEITQESPQIHERMAEDDRHHHHHRSSSPATSKSTTTIDNNSNNNSPSLFSAPSLNENDDETMSNRCIVAADVATAAIQTAIQQQQRGGGVTNPLNGEDADESERRDAVGGDNTANNVSSWSATNSSARCPSNASTALPTAKTSTTSTTHDSLGSCNAQGGEGDVGEMRNNYQYFGSSSSSSSSLGTSMSNWEKFGVPPKMPKFIQKF